MEFTLNVAVLDDVSRSPIPYAKVVVVSDTRKQEGFTAPDGTVKFKRLSPGIYHVRVTSQSYSFSQEPTVKIAGTGEKRLVLLGQATRLHTIAAVAARSPSARNSPERAAGSPQTLLSKNIADSLLTLAGIGLSSNGNLSLDNHGAQTVSQSVNGAPILPNNGLSVGLSPLMADVFQGGGVSDGFAGSPHGSIGFQTYDPTLDWMGRAVGGAESFGGVLSELQETGTTGTFGISLVHARSETGQPGNADYFRDTSGLLYQHDLTSTNTGDTLTVRHAFGPNDVAYFDYGDLNATAPYQCRLLEGTLPCGYGPGNYIVNNTRYAQFRNDLTLDRASLAVNVFRSTNDTDFDLSALISNGVYSGFSSTSETTRSGAIAQFSVLLSKSTAPTSFTLQTFNDQSRLRGPITSPNFVPPISSLRTTQAKITQTLVDARRVTVSASAAAEAVGGATGTAYGLDLSYGISNTDSLIATIQNGSLGTPIGTDEGIAPAASLAFDCHKHSAVGYGPTLGADVIRTSHTSLKWLHTAAHVSASILAYTDRDDNAEQTGVVPASALSIPVTSAYLNAAAQAGSVACGTPVGLTPNSLFFQISAPVQRLVNDGLDVDVTAKIGSKAALSASYSIGRSRAFGNSLLFAAGSPLKQGDQLPTIALQHANVGAAVAVTAKASALASLNYYSSGNYWRQSPVYSVDLGLLLKAEVGQLVLGMRNVGNVAAPEDPAFNRFPYYDRAYTPRTFFVRYDLPLGRTDVEHTPISSNPSAYTLIYPVPLSDGDAADDLTPNRQSPTCGQENVAQATAYLGEIQDFSSSVQRALASGSDIPLRDPSVSGAITLGYVPTAHGYAIRIALAPDRARTTAPLLRCARVHLLTMSDALQYGIYAPGYDERQRYPGALYYMPSVGIYLPPAVEDETNGVPAGERPLGASPPADLFQIDDGACPATERDAVAAILPKIKKYIQNYNGQRTIEIDTLRIAAHPSSHGTWFEISGGDMDFVLAIATCVNAPVVDRKDLDKRHLSGAGFPSLNYTKTIGFYRFPPGE